MISTDEYLARCNEAIEARADAGYRREEQHRELCALAILTGMTVTTFRTAGQIEALVVTTAIGQTVASGPADEVLEALVVPRPEGRGECDVAAEDAAAEEGDEFIHVALRTARPRRR